MCKTQGGPSAQPPHTYLEDVSPITYLISLELTLLCLSPWSPRLSCGTDPSSSDLVAGTSSL